MSEETEMVTWLTYGLAMSEVVLLYGFFSRLGVRETYKGHLAKNRRWVADNPAFHRQFPPPRYSIWLFYLVGCAWVTLYSCLFFVAPYRSWLLHSIFFPQAVIVYPWVLFGVLTLLYIWIEHLRLGRRIPLPDRRRASLVRRELRDFLSPLWVYLGYLFLAGIVVVNAIALFRGMVDLRATLRGMIALVVMAVILAFLLRISLRRKDGPVDDLFGNSYRRFEVTMAVGVLCLMVLVSGLATLHFVWHLPVLPSPTATTLALSAMSQLLVLWVVLGLPLFPRHPGALEHFPDPP